MDWIALVGPEQEENLSLRYLAASLIEAGFEARIVAFNGADDFPAAIATIAGAERPPLLVGVSLAFQWRAPDFLAFVMGLRETGYRGHVTVGGHFATFAAAELLRDFAELDSVCRQEAEATLVSLCRALAAGAAWQEIPGVVARGGDGAARFAPMPEVPDLGLLPPPVRGEPARCFDHGIAPLVSSRGCYANCTFCCIAAWHEQTLPGKRYRLREPADVAAEMAAMRRGQGIDIFVFHDDNFFIPNHGKSLARLHALADAIEAEGLRDFATVVKARPGDVTPEVFRVLVERLGCIRCYVGIETDADQGLVTLRRWGRSSQNHRAIDVARALGLFVCFNILMFDPDTTLASVRRNLEFVEYAADFPFNFGRVELYAGTPLLARLQAEGRCRGDYLQWDYDLGSPDVQRFYQLAMACFVPRNFGEAALANTIQGMRFDLEIVRRFHPDAHDERVYAAGRALSRRLALDSVATLRELLAHVEGGAGGDGALAARLSARARAVEGEVRAEMLDLAAALGARVGRGLPLTYLGDRVATPLQRAVPPELEVTP
ncbi:MAG TPA: cobalamin-dependent protein [Polyangia bacterium]|nr:cobalamin-dependent protein [Polyangia bacterium]